MTATSNEAPNRAKKSYWPVIIGAVIPSLAGLLFVFLYISAFSAQERDLVDFVSEIWKYDLSRFIFGVLTPLQVLAGAGWGLLLRRSLSPLKASLLAVLVGIPFGAISSCAGFMLVGLGSI
jgi:hypothetical protein